MTGACAARFDPAVEAAFLAVYGIDTLADGLSPRRTLALLRNLPSGSLESWTDVDASWTVETHMLAEAIDAINWLTWMTARVNSKKEPKKPKPIPRPGDKARKRPAKKRALNVRTLADAIQGTEGVRST